MFKSSGDRDLSLPERMVLKLKGMVRRRTLVRVNLDDRGHATNYLCETPMDAYRPLSLWIKEAGTMAWLDAEVRPADVFMDIGANIGIYSIAAALRMGVNGRVYAFEPHKVNALSLLRNIQANGLGGRIDVFSCALSDDEGMLDFNYASLSSASTASQLGHRRVPGTGHEFEPVAAEKVYAASVDRLIERGSIVAPDLVKIDVDGNEIGILRGMRQLLRSEKRPRALQVELNVGEQDRIIETLAEADYALVDRHLTLAGKKQLASGSPLNQIAHNALFKPVN
jgi:FkbM family methyltransferase